MSINKKNNLIVKNQLIHNSPELGCEDVFLLDENNDDLDLICDDIEKSRRPPEKNQNVIANVDYFIKKSYLDSGFAKIASNKNESLLNIQQGESRSNLPSLNIVNRVIQCNGKNTTSYDETGAQNLKNENVSNSTKNTSSVEFNQTGKSPTSKPFSRILVQPKFLRVEDSNSSLDTLKVSDSEEETNSQHDSKKICKKISNIIDISEKRNQNNMVRVDYCKTQHEQEEADKLAAYESVFKVPHIHDDNNRKTDELTSSDENTEDCSSKITSTNVGDKEEFYNYLRIVTKPPDEERTEQEDDFLQTRRSLRVMLVRKIKEFKEKKEQNEHTLNGSLDKLEIKLDRTPTPVCLEISTDEEKIISKKNNQIMPKLVKESARKCGIIANPQDKLLKLVNKNIVEKFNYLSSKNTTEEYVKESYFTQNDDQKNCQNTYKRKSETACYDNKKGRSSFENETRSSFPLCLNSKKTLLVRRDYLKNIDNTSVCSQSQIKHEVIDVTKRKLRRSSSPKLESLQLSKDSRNANPISEIFKRIPYVKIEKTPELSRDSSPQSLLSENSTMSKDSSKSNCNLDFNEFEKAMEVILQENSLENNELLKSGEDKNINNILAKRKKDKKIKKYAVNEIKLKKYLMRTSIINCGLRSGRAKVINRHIYKKQRKKKLETFKKTGKIKKEVLAAERVEQNLRPLQEFDVDKLKDCPSDCYMSPLSLSSVITIDNSKSDESFELRISTESLFDANCSSSFMNHPAMASNDQTEDEISVVAINDSITTSASASTSTSTSCNVLQVLPQPLDIKNGPVLATFYASNIFIVVQETLISFYRYLKIQQLFNFPNPFHLIGETQRKLSGIEVKTEFRKRLCYNDGRPNYVELRAKHLASDGYRECIYVALYANIYYLTEEISKIGTVFKPVAVMKCIELDRVCGLISEICYTTLPNLCHFIVAWNERNVNRTITGLCKYSLTPDLQILGSIREFQPIEHQIYTLECLPENQLIGIDSHRVSIWNYISGDLLISINSKLSLDRNLWAFIEQEINDKYLFLLQYKEQQIELIAINLKDLSFRVISSQEINLNFNLLLSSTLRGDIFMATFTDGRVLVLKLNDFKSFLIKRPFAIRKLHDFVRFNPAENCSQVGNKEGKNILSFIFNEHITEICEKLQLTTLNEYLV